jgi:predicted HAD superfamily Cof-like phosphohydrolase
MSINNFNDVGDFHEKFGLDNVTHRLPGKRMISEALLKFRLDFMREELDELEQAVTRVISPDGTRSDIIIDDAKVFDALIDLVYVALGTAQLLGYPWHAGWDEVQRANMNKERCKRVEDSTRGSLFDVIKPTNWTPPDITRVLRSYGWRV